MREIRKPSTHQQKTSSVHTGLDPMRELKLEGWQQKGAMCNFDIFSFYYIFWQYDYFPLIPVLT